MIILDSNATTQEWTLLRLGTQCLKKLKTIKINVASEQLIFSQVDHFVVIVGYLCVLVVRNKLWCINDLNPPQSKVKVNGDP
jgi:hypothetical protein